MANLCYVLKLNNSNIGLLVFFYLDEILNLNFGPGKPLAGFENNNKKNSCATQHLLPLCHKIQMSAAEQIIKLLGPVNRWRPRYGKDQLPSERNDKPKAIWYRRTPPNRPFRYILNLFLLGNGVPVSLVHKFYEQKWGVNDRWERDVQDVAKGIYEGRYTRWWQPHKQGWSNEVEFEFNNIGPVRLRTPGPRLPPISAAKRKALDDKEEEDYYFRQEVYRNSREFGFDHATALSIYREYSKTHPRFRRSKF